MDFKRKLLIAALPLAFCLSTTAYAEMTLKIAEIPPAGYPTVVAQENMGKKIVLENYQIQSKLWIRK